MKDNKKVLQQCIYFKMQQSISKVFKYKKVFQSLSLLHYSVVPTTGTRAACCSPQRFLRLAELFRKNLQI